MKTRSFIAVGAVALAGVGFGALALSGSPAGAATILTTSCPGQSAPVTVGASGFTCSSEGIVTNGGHTATVQQILTVTGGGDATVLYQIVGGPLDFPVVVQWKSHAGLSNGPGVVHPVTGTIPAGATELRISNTFLACGGQQDIKAIPAGQETTDHVSGSFRLAGPVVTLAACRQPPPSTVPPTTAPPTTVPVTVPSTTPGTAPATVPSAAPRQLPATL
jgi:hypothetical protein